MELPVRSSNHYLLCNGFVTKIKNNSDSKSNGPVTASNVNAKSAKANDVNVILLCLY